MAVKITRRVEKAIVVADVSRVGAGGNDQVEYVVSSATGDADFVITDAGSTPQNRMLTSKMPQAGPGVWRRVWPLPDDPIAVDSEHNFAMEFARTPKYTYKVTLLKGDGTKVPVIDLDYEADSPAEFFLQPLMVALL